MEISHDEVKKIAQMARLALSEQELNEYKADMENILNLAAQLKDVDTSNLAPMAHPLEQAQSLRSDVVTETVDRPYFQSIAPLVKEGYYLVPKVIENGKNTGSDH